MHISGAFIIGSEAGSGSESFAAYDPTTGSELEPRFYIANRADVERACSLARAAFASYRHSGLDDRARFLETIAEKIEALGDSLIQRAMAETALPRPRLEGERLRTVTQLRFFADVVRRAEWLDLRIEHALAERTPPRPDLRLRRIPLGPVAVFGASNFPLAFSVAGGDTASALAAGCPVVVRAHAAHPGVSELIGSAIAAAVLECGLHPGVFSMLAGPSYDLGSALVADPNIKAVGFTGSRSGGLALCAVAAARAEPIPVYAEMSSVNPIFLLPGALQDAAALAQGYVASLTLGAGQFCTNPGLIFAPAGAALDRFIAAAAAALTESGAQTMLTAGIHAAYQDAITRLRNAKDVELCAQGSEPAGERQARAALFVTDAQTFASNPLLAQESFGPVAIIVRVRDTEAFVDLIDGLEGQLTATIHMNATDSRLASRLLESLELRAGRIIVNGWPTGVEVSRAMVHGGPFPATSDGKTTSVGALAIERFLRPVCYQDVPDAILPQELREAASGLERTIDGVRVAPARTGE